VVDDESDVADLFRQRFRHEVRQGVYAIHCAGSRADALGKLAGAVEPTHASAEVEYWPATLMASVLLSGCVSQGAYDQLQAQNQQLQQQVAADKAHLSPNASFVAI
jgi:hypothetical protein